MPEKVVLAANEFSYLEGPWSAKTLIFEVPLAGCIWDLRRRGRAKLKAVAAGRRNFDSIN